MVENIFEFKKDYHRTKMSYRRDIGVAVLLSILYLIITCKCS